MRRLLILGLAPACYEPECIDAPEYLPRAACDRAHVEVVIHQPARWPWDADVLLEGHLQEAAAILELHGIDLELASVQMDAYFPRLDMSAEGCDALDAWGERVQPDDGRIHIWAMASIRHGDRVYEGITRSQAIALIPHAQPRVLAHEFGHAFGLHHSDDPTDLMHPNDLDQAFEFTEEQGEIMRPHACALSAR